ncbi:fumarate/nitrate reduction transcriptional regulator Fnr [Castellaniella sp.]|uniref:fumarate/nitrate reduction transcriptional regulator Fnr n=1 Tax=Castellaniella sp. TaxID=1955812 RepID=UPI00355F0A21
MRKPHSARRIMLALDATRCSTCMLNTICLPLGMSQHEVQKMDELVEERLRLPKGGTLFREGDAANALYGIRSGSFKTQIEDARGQVQITGFLLPGEVLGMDGLMHDEQLSHAIALEDSEVCIIRLDAMDRLATQLPTLQRQLRRLMSKEIGRSHQMLLSIGGLRSEQRLAVFLLNLSQRLQNLGYSPHEFILRMSREEIGNYLGLTLETVSRLFSRFAREGLIRVQQREVQILDQQALHALSGTDAA